MTVTRQPTRDALICAVCHKPGPALDIDHIKNRGAGGSKARDVPENKIALCRPCHSLKTLGKIKTWVETKATRTNKTYIYCWRKADADVVIRVPVKVDARHGCLVSCDGAEPNKASYPLELVGDRSASSQAGEGEEDSLAVVAPAVREQQLSGPSPSPAHGAGGGRNLDGPTGSSLVGTADEQGSPPPAPIITEGEESQSPTGTSPLRVLTPSVDPATVPRLSPSVSLESDWSDLNDEMLQQLYEEGEHRQREGFLWKCHAVYQYRENHVQAWGESWTDQAIERFGCSRPYAYAYANLWRIYKMSETYLREGMASLTDSRTIMQMIGRRPVEEGVKLLEAAVSHVATYGSPPSIAALTAEEKPERERHECPLCNFSHYVVVQGEWKA